MKNYLLKKELIYFYSIFTSMMLGSLIAMLGLTIVSGIGLLPGLILTIINLVNTIRRGRWLLLALTLVWFGIVYFFFMQFNVLFDIAESGIPMPLTTEIITGILGISIVTLPISVFLLGRIKTTN